MHVASLHDGVVHEAGRGRRYPLVGIARDANLANDGCRMHIDHSIG
jgi:hypothetical protein